MNKMIKIAKNLSIFAKVSRIVSYAAAIILTVCAFILFSINDSFWMNGSYTVALGNVTLDLIPDGAVPPDITRNGIIAGLIFCAFILLLAGKCTNIVQGILLPMSEGKPFDSSVATSLRKLGWIALITGAVVEIGNVAFSMLHLSSFNLDALFNSQLVAGYTVEYTMNYNFILLFAVLNLMSYVFRYGEQLQQLSDETL